MVYIFQQVFRVFTIFIRRRLTKLFNHAFVAIDLLVETLVLFKTFGFADKFSVFTLLAAVGVVVLSIIVPVCLIVVIFSGIRVIGYEGFAVGLARLIGHGLSEKIREFVALVLLKVKEVVLLEFVEVFGVHSDT